MSFLAKQPSQESFVAFSCPVPFISLSIVKLQLQGDGEFKRHQPDTPVLGPPIPSLGLSQGDGPETDY